MENEEAAKARHAAVMADLESIWHPPEPHTGLRLALEQVGYCVAAFVAIVLPFEAWSAALVYALRVSTTLGGFVALLGPAATCVPVGIAWNSWMRSSLSDSRRRWCWIIAAGAAAALLLWPRS